MWAIEDLKKKKMQIELANHATLPARIKQHNSCASYTSFPFAKSAILLVCEMPYIIIYMPLYCQGEHNSKLQQSYLYSHTGIHAGADVYYMVHGYWYMLLIN